MDQKTSPLIRHQFLRISVVTLFTILFVIIVGNFTLNVSIHTDTSASNPHFKHAVFETIRSGYSGVSSGVKGQRKTNKTNASFTMDTSFDSETSQSGSSSPMTSSTDMFGTLSRLSVTSEAARRKHYMGLSCPRERSSPGWNLPKIALASFPRSGNGWTRHLIQYATKLYVGSARWADRQKHRNTDTFQASGDDVRNKRVVIIKTHDRPKPGLYTQAVLLIRNPYRSIVSDVYKRIFLRRNFSQQKMLQFFKTNDWMEQVRRLGKSWMTMTTSWINNTNTLHVVANERLLHNTEEELSKIISFINQPLDKRFIKCAVKAYYPSTSSTRFNIDPYTDDMRKLINSYIHVVNRTLLEHKYQALPTYPKILSY
ncbi:WSCD family member CG9164-like [Apostichopus japonicus]|uniref:WSCD family member CG9164-like n=1 Tax=Stichopus japonicus TaxID=307972 RepID=UPI003AB1EAA2